MRKRVLIATGGGDCPGLNAVIRAVVMRASQERDWEVVGSINAFDGVLNEPNEIVILGEKEVAGVHIRGGTIIGTTNKGGPFAWPIKNKDGSWGSADRSDEMMRRLQYLGVDAVSTLVVTAPSRSRKSFMKKAATSSGYPRPSTMTCRPRTSPSGSRQPYRRPPPRLTSW